MINNNPYQYLDTFDKVDWFLDIPMIIAQKSTKLWLGKGLLFQSKDKDLLDFLNKLKDKDKWFEKLYKFGLQESLLGKSFLMWMLTKNNELTLLVPTPSFMDRVAKFNEQEQSAELFFQQEQSDSAKLTWVTMQNGKVKVEVFSGSKEIILGSTRTKLKPNIEPVEEYELKNPFDYLPIVEITNLPYLNLYGNSTQLNTYPDCQNVYKLIHDVNKAFTQKQKERVLNRTRALGKLKPEQILAIKNGEMDISELADDFLIDVGVEIYNKNGNSSIVIIQGDPKFDSYWLDINNTAKLIFNGAGYDYDEHGSDVYTNKTQSMFNNKYDMETTETKIAHYTPYIYRMLDILVTYSKKENGKNYWNGIGERPYSFKFIPIAMTDQIVQDQIINSRLNNGTMSQEEAIGEYDNIDPLMAENKLENIINETKKINNKLGENKNDNEQRNKNSINETSTFALKTNSTINKEM